MKVIFVYERSGITARASLKLMLINALVFVRAALLKRVGGYTSILLRCLTSR